MSGPTPIAATHQLDIHYSVPSLDHVMQLRCDAVSGVGGYALNQWLGSPIAVQDAVDNLVLLLKVMWKATAAFDTWTLQEYDSGVYLPVAQGSIGVAGTSSGADAPAAQTTLIFRAASFGFMRVILLEAADTGILSHGGYGQLSGAFADLVDDLLDKTDGHAGAWLRSRGESPTNTFVSFTTAPNKKLRRKRGLT